MEKVGIITVTYNSENVLPAFLECIWNQSYQNFFLYIIDNASQDSTLDIIEKIDNDRMSIISNKKNHGVAKANNQGIIEAINDDCNQILLINNDVEFEKCLIDKLLKAQYDIDCSLTSPKMLFHSNKDTIWYAGSWFLEKRGFLPIHRGYGEIDKGQYNKIREVDYAPTCCLLVKKEVFDDIGFMDENYFVYFDDTDFSYRIYRDGRHKIYYCPDIEFYHKVGSLTKSFRLEDKKIYRGDFFLRYTIRNHIYFLKKIGGFYAYLFILWLFFKNNIQFILNQKIKKDFRTWKLINMSYMEGIFL